MNQNYIKFLSNLNNLNYKTIINKIRRKLAIQLSINQSFNFSNAKKKKKKKYIERGKENFIKFSIMIVKSAY